MNKKLFLLILIPALLLIGMYLYVRFSLQYAIHKDSPRLSHTIRKTDTDTTSAKDSSSLDLRPLFIERLQQVVAKTTNNLYQLSIGNMEIDALSSTAAIYNVTIRPNKDRLKELQKLNMTPSEVYSLSFDKLEIKNINLDDAVTQKTMDYQWVKLTNPVFEIYVKGNKKTKNKEEFTHRFLKEMKKLAIQNITVSGGKIIIHNKGKVNLLKEVDMDVHDVLIDSTTRNASNRFLFARKANISFKDYKIITGKEQYHLTLDKVRIQATDHRMEITGLNFHSPYTKEEFNRRQKFAKEYFRFSIPSLTVSGADWWRLINEEEITANLVTINGGKLFVYLDRSLPAKSKMGSFPVQLLMKAPVKINIQQLKTRNFDLTYEEYNPLSKQSGKIYMDDINIHASNISNLKQKKLPPVRVQAHALFMRKIPINANFTFSHDPSNSGRFTAAITSEKDFDGTLVNSFAMPLGLVKIDEGRLQRMQAHIKGNELRASGEVSLLYQDLKLSLLEKDKGEKELDTKSVTTLLANTFVLKKDNPKKQQTPRREKVNFERIPEGGFFMLVWKTMLAGSLKTIGAPEKIARKTINKQ